MLTPTTTRRDAVFNLLNQGLDLRAISEKLNVPRNALYPYKRDWKILTNHPDMHHSGKGEIIDFCIRGLTDLKIGELFGFQGDGITPGDMSEAFSKYGTVNAKSKLDGDAIKVLHSWLGEVGESDRNKLDVLAIDGYGLKYGAIFLQRGATSLIKSSGGFLFVSFNLPKMFCARNRNLQHLAGIHFRTLTPDEGDMSDYVARCCYMYGHVASHLKTLRLGSGGEGLLIMAFKLDPWVPEGDRIEVVKQLFDLEG